MGSRKRAIARIVLALSLFFVTIYTADSYPGLVPFRGYLAASLVEATILLLSVLAMWNAGLLRGVQSRSRLALLEVAVLATTLVVLMLVNGIDCNPLTLCITVGGSYMGEPLGIYLSLVGLNIVVAVSEEFFSRAYLLRDVYHGLNSGVLAVSMSALAFALSHVPVLSLGSYNTSPVVYLLVSIFLVGVSYGLVYWWTGWNLMLVVLMHFFYDTFGGMIALDPFDPLSPIRFYAVLVFLPGAAIVLFHYAITHVRLVEKTTGPSPCRGPRPSVSAVTSPLAGLRDSWLVSLDLATARCPTLL